MKIPEYPSTNAVSSQDVILLDGPSGTRKISPKDFFWSMINSNAETTSLRKCFYRGFNLGPTFTDAQKSEIKSGSFKGLFLGDYWNINGIAWRIVDIDYWFNLGDIACMEHHLVIMPDTVLYNEKMNDANTTEGGYVGSKMYKEGLNQAKNKVNAAFGEENVLNHRELLVDTVINGIPTEAEWVNSTVELPNQIMMYGSSIFNLSGDGTIIPYSYTVDKTQLAIMSIYPRYISMQIQTYWLRDIVSSIDFAQSNGNGYSATRHSSASSGVRPVFGLTGGAA